MDIIILAAAGAGLVAFVGLAIIIVRQGRALRDFGQRIGPPVPPAAAPSLERVRAAAAQSVAPGAVVPAVASEEPPEVPVPVSPPQPDPAAPRQTARQAAAARAAADKDKRARAQQKRQERGRGAAGDGAGPSGRGLVAGALIVVVIGLLGTGGWYVFLRDDGSAHAGSGQPQGTTATTPDTGEVPEDVPPLANKAAYTVAVLNASNVTGAAANTVAPQVQADGYTLGVVDNAAKQGLAVSQVQYVKGRQEVGWNLAKDLHVTRAVQVDSLSQGRIGTADAVVIVGKDLAG